MNNFREPSLEFTRSIVDMFPLAIGGGKIPMPPWLALILGCCLLALGLWRLVVVLMPGFKPEGSRWGRKGRGRRAPATRVGSFTVAVAITAWGYCLIVGGYFGRLNNATGFKILGSAFVLVLVAAVNDYVVDWWKRRKKQREGTNEPKGPRIKKWAHFYTLSAICFGILGYVFIRIAIDGWHQNPPRFFEGSIESKLGAWIPTLVISLELLLVVQAIRYWIAETPTVLESDDHEDESIG